MASRSLGIELDNAGRLKRVSGKWIAWFKRPYPASDVIEAVHKYDTKRYGWHTYTDAQISIATEVAATLIANYQLKELVGHDDISPRRKWDPGPAFPMETFRDAAFRRAEELGNLAR